MLVEVLRSAKPERVEADVQVGGDSCNTAAIPGHRSCRLSEKIKKKIMGLESISVL